MSGDLSIKRAYEEPDPADGRRVLVDRLWPRGVSRERAGLDDWLKEVAPSGDLRKWFGHDPAKWEEFGARYRAELDAHPNEIRQLLEWWGVGDLNLVYSAADTEHNDAVVLAAYLRQQSEVDHQEDS
jgi:uncharacterized protein YeaO (DUF488 family)